MSGLFARQVLAAANPCAMRAAILAMMNGKPPRTMILRNDACHNGGRGGNGASQYLA